MTGDPLRDRPITRRAALSAAAAGLVAVAAGCNRSSAPEQSLTPAPPTTSPPAPAPPPVARFVINGPRTQPKVALTFHADGDPAVAEQVLRYAEVGGAKVTAFVLGSWLEANPLMVRRMLGAGHQLGNHTYSHPHAAQLTPELLRDEIVRCRDVLVRLSGSKGVAVRIPETSRPVRSALQIAAEAGYPLVVGADVDPRDWEDPPSDRIVEHVLARARPGSIVGMHFGHVATAVAIPRIVSGLRERGLQAVTVGDLFAI